jgi:hypothetical protein
MLPHSITRTQNFVNSGQFFQIITTLIQRPHCNFIKPTVKPMRGKLKIVLVIRVHNVNKNKLSPRTKIY